MDNEENTPDQPLADMNAQSAEQPADTSAHTPQDIQASVDKAAKNAEKTFDALAPSAAESEHLVATSQKKIDVLHKLSVNSVYLMGSSFIVGVLFTVFVLLVLDFMRRNAEENVRDK